MRVLGDVGEGFGDDEVQRAFDGFGKPAHQRVVDADRDGAAFGQGDEGRAEAAVGEDGGVQPAGKLAQLRDRGLQLRRRPA